jgi:hypothetical protein
MDGRKFQVGKFQVPRGRKFQVGKFQVPRKRKRKRKSLGGGGAFAEDGGEDAGEFADFGEEGGVLGALRVGKVVRVVEQSQPKAGFADFLAAKADAVGEVVVADGFLRLDIVRRHGSAGAEKLADIAPADPMPVARFQVKTHPSRELVVPFFQIEWWRMLVHQAFILALGTSLIGTSFLGTWNFFTWNFKVGRPVR